MVFSPGKALAVAASLATASVVPSAALAETQPGPAALPAAYVLDVVTSRDFQSGEYDGTMRITITPDGIISGLYQQAYEGGPKVVAGGLEPNGRVWLDIGRTHLNGTFVNGVLRTTADIPSPYALHVDATPMRAH